MCRKSTGYACICTSCLCNFKWLVEVWIHPLNEDRSRKGEFFTLYVDQRHFPDKFFENYRMTTQQFDEILHKIAPLIKKKNSNFRKAITPEEKLSLTLSFLATRDSYTGLAARYRLGKSTVTKIISQTCAAIWQVMQPEVMPKPTHADWKRIEEGFRKRWHFPNCIGALDGKHISIKSPPLSGSLFYNYKGYFSLVLLALVDASYRFIYVDIGEYGSNADSNVFQFSNFGAKYIGNKLNVPGLKRLPNYNQEGPMPHVIVADEAFPLLHTLMRPYPRSRESTLPRDECIFNYRLSRARMVVENAFGILAMRWRIFDRRMPLSTENADKVIQAATCLHNYLTEEKDFSKITAELNPEGRSYGNGSVVLWLPRLACYRSRDDAMGVRDIFKGYLHS